MCITNCSKINACFVDVDDTIKLKFCFLMISVMPGT